LSCLVIRDRWGNWRNRCHRHWSLLLVKFNGIAHDILVKSLLLISEGLRHLHGSGHGILRYTLIFGLGIWKLGLRNRSSLSTLGQDCRHRLRMLIYATIYLMKPDILVHFKHVLIFAYILRTVKFQYLVLLTRLQLKILFDIRKSSHGTNQKLSALIWLAWMLLSKIDNLILVYLLQLTKTLWRLRLVDHLVLVASTYASLQIIILCLLCLIEIIKYHLKLGKFGEHILLISQYSL